MSNVQEVNDQNFKKEVLESEIPVLVDFWAPWCGPCKMMSPVIDSIQKKFENVIKIVKMNTDENSEMPSQYNIQGIPSLLYFEKGLEEGRLVGYQPENVLEEKLKAFKK